MNLFKYSHPSNYLFNIINKKINNYILKFKNKLHLKVEARFSSYIF